MTKAEINAVVSMLESPDEWEGPEALAKAIIEALDEARADRKTYAGVIELDLSGPAMYQGIGYFPGAASARNAVAKHPAAGLAKKIVVVPVLSPKGFTKMVAELDAPPLADGDFALVREDAALFKLGWKGAQKDRKVYLDRLNGSMVQP